MNYFIISDRTGSCFEACVPKHERIFRPNACKSCSTLPENLGPPNSLAVKSIGNKSVAIAVTSWIYGVLNVNLIDKLSGFGNYLRLGKLTDPDDNLIDDYRTFVCVHSIIPRGTEKSQHRFCKLCGEFVYSCNDNADAYVTRASISESIHIYEFGMMELLVSEAVFEIIDKYFSSLIYAKKITVRTDPIDGLPPLLYKGIKQDQLENYTPNVPSWLIE